MSTTEYVMAVVLATAVVVVAVNRGKPYYDAYQVERESEQLKQAFIVRAQDAVRKKLVDPRSAEFQIGQVATNTLRKPIIDAVVCGSVNAKNRLGGYVGFQNFFWNSNEEEVRIVGTNANDALWAIYCKEYEAGMAYRPALGIDVALAEIERGRGSVYDVAVVDACLKLFRDKDYKIPE